MAPKNSSNKTSNLSSKSNTQTLDSDPGSATVTSSSARARRTEAKEARSGNSTEHVMTPPPSSAQIRAVTPPPSSNQIQAESPSSNRKTVEAKAKKDKENSSYTEFNKEVWDQHDHFQVYIDLDLENKTRFICKACKAAEIKECTGQYDYLDRHLGTTNHRTSVSNPDHKDEIDAAIQAYKEFRKKKKSDQINSESIKKMRIELTCFLLRHQLPFTIGPEIVKFTQYLMKKYNAANLLGLGVSHTTIGQIARECVAKSFKQEVYEDLKNSVFSLSFDESAERNGPSYLCTHARYIKNGKIHHKLLALNQIQDSKTGQTLHEMVMKEIFSGPDKEILLRNFVGAVSDGGPNMFSPKDAGLLNRLKEDNKDILLAHDYCHLFNLVLRDCLKKLPSDVLLLVKDICGHFTQSCLRRAKFKQVQDSLGEKDITDFKQILTYTKTRWSSVYEASERIKLLWVFLEAYFDQVKSADLKAKVPNRTDKNRLYLDLLCDMVKRINNHIIFFQSDEQDYSRIMPKLRETFCLTAEIIINTSNMSQDPIIRYNELIDLPFGDKTALKKFLRPITEFKSMFYSKFPDLEYIKQVNLDEESLSQYFTCAQDFLIEFLSQMKLKLPLKDEFLNICEVIQLKGMNPTTKNDWNTLARKFPDKINLSAFVGELDVFEFNFARYQTQYMTLALSPITFWTHMAFEFPNLSRLALIIMTLPYSTCSIERTFSVLRQVKGPERNRLCETSLEACLLIQQTFRDKEEFDIDAKMLTNYYEMWKKQTEPQQKKQVSQGAQMQILVDKEEAKQEENKTVETTIITNQQSMIVEDIQYTNKPGGNKRQPMNALDRRNYEGPLTQLKTNDSDSEGFIKISFASTQPNNIHSEDTIPQADNPTSAPQSQTGINPT